jgi:ABC-2 type transport system ATP-binding protein
MAGELVIEARGVCKSFGRVAAVRGLDLSVQRGEIFGLIGPDGAGKSTVVRILATVASADRGEVRVLGMDVRRMSVRVRRRVGYVTQNFSLYPDLTAYENLEFFAALFEVPRHERARRAQEVLELVGLAPFGDRRAGAFSGGMKRKLSLACALVHEPELLLLDEPTTGVDPASRRELWDILAQLHLRGVTIVLTTPYLDEAERCSRVALIYKGRVVICGPPAQVKEQATGRPLEFRPVTPQDGRLALRAAQEALAQLPGVAEVLPLGDVIRVYGRDGLVLEAAVRAALEEKGIVAERLRWAAPRLEEAFISLIRQAEGERE